LRKEVRKNCLFLTMVKKEEATGGGGKGQTNKGKSSGLGGMELETKNGKKGIELGEEGIWSRKVGRRAVRKKAGGREGGGEGRQLKRGGEAVIRA